MREKSIALLKRQLEELNKIGNNPQTKGEYSFGVDTLSNIISGLLSNPQIWGIQ